MSQFKEGGMSLDQLKNYFGADNIDADGSFKKSGGGADAFKDDKKIRKFFVNELGRSTDDWDDDVSFDKDLNTAVRSMYDGNGGGTKEKKPETNQWSQPMAEARAGVKAYDETILTNAGDYITGKKKDMNADYLKSYKLNLANELKPTNADGSSRDSAIQDKKEEQAVQGFE